MNLPKDVAFFVCDFETTGVDTDKDYPIEVGGVFTDNNFNIIELYSSMVHWQHVVDKLNIKVNTWPEPWDVGFHYHQITPKQYTHLAKSKNDIFQNLWALRDAIINITGADKVILLSDNIQFEYNFMKRIFNEVSNDWPFHYCGWDTSLLLEATGVGDPKDPPHRALPDSLQLLDSIREAMNRVKVIGM